MSFCVSQCGGQAVQCIVVPVHLREGEDIGANLLRPSVSCIPNELHESTRLTSSVPVGKLRDHRGTARIDMESELVASGRRNMEVHLTWPEQEVVQAASTRPSNAP